MIGASWDKFSGNAMGSFSTYEIYYLNDMSYRVSDNINIETPNLEEAVQFYTEVFGLRIAEMGNDWAKFDTGKFNFYVSRGRTLGPIMEFQVQDLEKAKEAMLERGCVVIRWEGKGKPCYMQDPFGFVFNLWEV
jgi:predicted enzyme related to lactoylglutathione lyase